MPTILDLFKQANNNQEVTVWDGTTQKPGIIDKVKDFVSAELNPTGPRIMFYKKLVTPPLIYGTETPRISLQGAVDPPRTLSVNSAKYQDKKSTSGKITIGSLLGGSANRPSDTIFKSTDGTPITKGTLGGGPGDYVTLRNSVEKETSYYVSQYPMGKSPFAGVLKGDLNTIGANVVGAGIGAAKNIVKKQVSKIVKKSRKQDPNEKLNTTQDNEGEVSPTDSRFQYYKPKKFIDYHDNDSKEEEQKYTTHIRNEKGVLNKRTNKDEIVSVLGYSKYDIINSKILQSLKDKDSISNNDLDNLFEKTNGLGNTNYVLFRQYREAGFAGDNILLPGAISGISEDVSPEWSSFKFVGSPFNQYRYIGVERSITFDLKLYATDQSEMASMKRNLNKLRRLVYPDENITAIQYGEKSGGYSPIVFNGNLVYLTINGLHYNLLGFIESMSISVEDGASWVSAGNETPSPSLMNISIGFKVINQVSIDNSDKTKQKLKFDASDEKITSIL